MSLHPLASIQENLFTVMETEMFHCTIFETKKFLNCVRSRVGSPLPIILGQTEAHTAEKKLFPSLPPRSLPHLRTLTVCLDKLSSLNIRF